MGLRKFFRDVKESWQLETPEEKAKKKKQWDEIKADNAEWREKHTVGDVDLDRVEEKETKSWIDEELESVKEKEKAFEEKQKAERDGISKTNNEEFQIIINTIQNDFPAEKIYDEKELQAQLRIFLKTKFPDSDVDREVHSNDSFVDLLVDYKYAFEVKVPRSRTELRNLIGQIEEYKENFPLLCVVIYDNEDYNISEDIKKYVDTYQTKYQVPSIVLQGKKRK
jgi:hypothetical protein